MILLHWAKNATRDLRFGGVALAVASMVLVPSTGGAYPLNPCPNIYYEEPFNSTRAVPPGCPPNAATQELIDEGQAPTPQPNTSPVPATPPPTTTAPSTTPPVPEDVRDAIAVVTPVNGTVDVQLINETYTTITYQVIGDTERRTLPGRQQITLQNLPTPVNLTMVRNDGGFIRVMPRSTTDPGLLSVSLSETPDLGENIRTLDIRANGQVFAY